MLKTTYGTAMETALMGANGDEYPGTRYIIDTGGNDPERYITRMNPFILEAGWKVVSVVRKGDGVGMWQRPHLEQNLRHFEKREDKKWKMESGR